MVLQARVRRTRASEKLLKPLGKVFERDIILSLFTSLGEDDEVFVIEGDDEPMLVLCSVATPLHEALLVPVASVTQNADLSPAGRKPHCKLVDFGIAKFLAVVLALDRNEACRETMDIQNPVKEPSRGVVGVADVDALSALVDLVLALREVEGRIEESGQERLDRSVVLVGRV